MLTASCFFILNRYPMQPCAFPEAALMDSCFSR